jgi:hypothetical protein
MLPCGKRDIADEIKLGILRRKIILDYPSTVVLVSKSQ